MKKLMLSGLLLASTLFVYAQKTDSTSTNGGINGNNELKLNLFYTIAGFPEINYERILKDDMSVGVAILVGLEKDSEYSFGIIPNFRVYFGNKKASGFFIEGNAAVISYKDNYYDYSYLAYSSYPAGTYQYTSPIAKTYTNFGLGAAAGGKFLTKKGFVGEIYLGVGRLFGDSPIEAYPRGGITIGKRF
ncbi:DUF3575 domain-containing protein [Pedobacter sp. LMG 31464]|uniref:DUF3575 domain-containing protein n=1 Tax=Pedobacter planticolens TaxID=2679964 RepID=A0A923DYG5_9SPHI|nr:DUF3575 domain-containing protein [Pedobacter planticolens]MBB2145103.1 DUF3575 domain-containing protein [Pedobacter planticolens]